MRLAPLIVLPVASWESRKARAKSAAACDRSLSHSCRMSSSVEKATRSAAPGCAFAQAAFSALMTAPSSMRVSAFGSVGDWPCLADRMIAVLSA